jgi:hypothetical protein
MSRKSDKLWDRDVSSAPNFESFNYAHPPISDKPSQNINDIQITKPTDNDTPFGTANICSVIVILVCMVFWSMIFLMTAIATKSPTIIIATVGTGLSYWAITWFVYWLGWKYYWIMLALGWVFSTGYMLTIISAITETFIRLF